MHATEHASEVASRQKWLGLQQDSVAGCTWLHFSAVHRDLLGAQLAQLRPQTDILQGHPSPCSGMHTNISMRRWLGKAAAGKY
jgi:hypothetical protein